MRGNLLAVLPLVLVLGACGPEGEVSSSPPDASSLRGKSILYEQGRFLKTCDRSSGDCKITPVSRTKMRNYITNDGRLFSYNNANEVTETLVFGKFEDGVRAIEHQNGWDLKIYDGNRLGLTAKLRFSASGCSYEVVVPRDPNYTSEWFTEIYYCDIYEGNIYEKQS